MNHIHIRPQGWRFVTVFQLLIGLLFTVSTLGQTDNLIKLNPGFESVITNGDYGWWSDGMVELNSDPAFAYSGVQSLKIMRKPNQGYVRAFSNESFTAEPGVPYLLSVKANFVALGRTLDNVLFLWNGSFIDPANGRDGRFAKELGKNWCEYQAIVVSPSAQKVNIGFAFSELGSTGYAYLDDFKCTRLGPPSVLVTSKDQTGYVGQTTTLSTEVSPSMLNKYQWKLNGSDLVGEKTSKLNVTPKVEGVYRYGVVVENLAGSTISDQIVLTVVNPPQPDITSQPVSVAVPNGMAFIPAGKFQMGDDRIPEASPVHSVTVSAYAMDQKEVSIELWESVRAWGNAHGYDLVAGGTDGVSHPVHSVNWFDVVKWNNARSEKDGKEPAYYEDVAMQVVYKSGEKVPNGVKWDVGYRLPTEAEWEKAARGAAVGKLYPWGTDEIRPEMANYGKGKSMPIGSYGANGYGLYDMAGNVWEWCWDFRSDQNGNGQYSLAEGIDPRGPSSSMFPDRVVRGGSWNNIAGYCKTAFRIGGHSYSRSYLDGGFRSVYPMIREYTPLWAGGGTQTSSGGYAIHTFTADGTFTPSFSGAVEVLVVGGGGGGGSGGGVPVESFIKAIFP